MPVSLSRPHFLCLGLVPFRSVSHTRSAFYKDLWYSVAQSMWIKQEGLLLISKDYRKWAQSPIEHFQLEVQPLCLAGVQLSSHSLTRGEMAIECRYYITWYFPISVSLLMLLAELLLCSQWRRRYSDSLLKWKYRYKIICSAGKAPCESYVTVTPLLLMLMNQCVASFYVRGEHQTYTEILFCIVGHFWFKNNLHAFDKNSLSAAVKGVTDLKGRVD